jgi:hypothetical protein
MDRRTEPPIWRTKVRYRKKMRYREDDGAVPRFFFLVGLALVMVWLTQQVWL